jgi:hypothetical protein
VIQQYQCVKPSTSKCPPSSSASHLLKPRSKTAIPSAVYKKTLNQPTQLGSGNLPLSTQKATVSKTIQKGSTQLLKNVEKIHGNVETNRRQVYKFLKNTKDSQARKIGLKTAEKIEANIKTVNTIANNLNKGIGSGNPAALASVVKNSVHALNQRNVEGVKLAKELKEIAKNDRISPEVQEMAEIQNNFVREQAMP